jgi:hypothetical protein
MATLVLTLVQLTALLTAFGAVAHQRMEAQQPSLELSCREFTPDMMEADLITRRNAGLSAGQCSVSTTVHRSAQNVISCA